MDRPETPLVANAIAAVRDLIGMPAYANGSRLPSEAQLADRFGISRPVLRQALSVLKEEGLIEARRGSGTYASGTQRSAFSFSNPESLADLEDCMRFRMVIESAAAGMAAKHADKDAIAGIWSAVTAMKIGKSADVAVLETDMAFHLAVARATRSRYYVITLETLMPHILFGLRLARQMRQIPANVTSRRVAAEHRAIATAIESGDEKLAAERMKEHLTSGIARIFGDRKW